MAEDHVSDLKKARDELIRQRRATISALTEGDKHTEHQLDTLIRYQQAIGAIDRLIKEEQRAAEWHSAQAITIAMKRIKAPPPKVAFAKPRLVRKCGTIKGNSMPLMRRLAKTAAPRLNSYELNNYVSETSAPFRRLFSCLDRPPGQKRPWIGSAARIRHKLPNLGHVGAGRGVCRSRERQAQ